jgi:hypothetical protein
MTQIRGCDVNLIQLAGTRGISAAKARDSGPKPQFSGAEDLLSNDEVTLKFSPPLNGARAKLPRLHRCIRVCTPFIPRPVIDGGVGVAEQVQRQ